MDANSSIWSQELRPSDECINMKVPSKPILPLKSCLKRVPLQDITNSAVKRKQVGFILPLKSYWREKKPMEKPVLADRVLSADEVLEQSLDDLSRNAYFAIGKMLTHEARWQGNIKLNFQPGVTQAYIQFLLKYDWFKEDLSDDERAVHSAVSSSQVVVEFQTAADLVVPDANDRPCLIIVEAASVEDIEYIATTYSQQTRLYFVILSDVWALLQLAKSKRLDDHRNNIVHFAVTRFDRTRDVMFGQNVQLYPLCYNESSNMTPLKVWQFNDRVRKVFHQLYVWSLLSYPLKGYWRIKDVPLEYLAPACGCFLIRTQDTASVLGSVDASVSAYEGNSESSRLYLPSILQLLYQLNNPHATMIPKDTSVTWKFMEDSIANSMSTASGGLDGQTFGQRFEFLRTSFVANLVHKIRERAAGPVISPGQKPWDRVEISVLFNHLSSLEAVKASPHNWPEILDLVEDKHIVVPGPLSHGPDVYAKLVDNSDPNKPVYNLLCFQSKHGKQDLNLLSVLDELGKCPFVSIDAKSHGRRIMSFKSSQRTRGGANQSATYRLTFVYVATTHKNVCTQVRQKKLCDEETLDYIRCTNAKCPIIPENVELIILKRKALIDLFGLQVYQHLKLTKQSVPTLSESHDINSTPTPMPVFTGSLNKETVMREIKDFVSKYDNFKLKRLELVVKAENESRNVSMMSVQSEIKLDGSEEKIYVPTVPRSRATSATSSGSLDSIGSLNSVVYSTKSIKTSTPRPKDKSISSNSSHDSSGSQDLESSIGSDEGLKRSKPQLVNNTNRKTETVVIDMNANDTRPSVSTGNKTAAKNPVREHKESDLPSQVAGRNATTRPSITVIRPKQVAGQKIPTPKKLAANPTKPPTLNPKKTTTKSTAKPTIVEKVTTGATAAGAQVVRQTPGPETATQKLAAAKKSAAVNPSLLTPSLKKGEKESRNPAPAKKEDKSNALKRNGALNK